MDLLAAKSKLVLAKTEASSVKKSNLARMKETRKNHKVSVRKLRHEKNVLSTKIRKLETELKKKGEKKSRTDKESLEVYKKKLDIHSKHEEKRYSMKVRQAEEKKEREQDTRRRRAVELQSQISIVGGRFANDKNNYLSLCYSPGYSARGTRDTYSYFELPRYASPPPKRYASPPPKRSNDRMRIEGVRRSPRLLKVRREDYGWQRNDSSSSNNMNHGMNMVSYRGNCVTEVGETQYMESSPAGLDMLTHAIDVNEDNEDNTEEYEPLQELL